MSQINGTIHLRIKLLFFFSNVIHFSWAYWRLVGSLVAGSYGICYCLKLINIAKRKYLEDEIKKLIGAIENVDSSIRRNISYFRETKFLHQASRQKENW